MRGLVVRSAGRCRIVRVYNSVLVVTRVGAEETGPRLIVLCDWQCQRDSRERRRKVYCGNLHAGREYWLEEEPKRDIIQGAGAA